MSADLYFSWDLFFLSSFSFRQLPAELAERINPIKIGHILGNECHLKMHVRNLEYPIPLQIGAQNHVLWWLHNLTATLTAYIVIDIDKCVNNYM